MVMKFPLRDEIKACLGLALPLAAAQLAQAATAFADTVMMGLLGSPILAAGGLGATTFMALLTISSGVVAAVSALVAESHGAGMRDRVGAITAHGLWLSLLLAIPIMLLLGHMEPLLQTLGQQPENARNAAAYLRAIAWGFWPALAFAVLKNFVTALSQPRPVMVIMIIGTVFNIIGNFVLMFGKLGLPALGLKGIGIASSLSLWLMFLLLWRHISSQPSLRSYRILPELKKFHWSLFQELVQTGWPIGVLVGMETGLFTITTFLMGQLGTIPLAAHHIALQTAAITFMVPLGISYATTVRVGQSLGQGNRAATRRAGYVGIALGAAFMSMTAIAFWLAPRAIIALYIDVNDPANRPVITATIHLLRVAALFQIVDGIQVTAGGALRGLKDTQIPMVIGLLSYWGIGMTSGYLLGLRLHLGGVGLWAGLAIGLTTAAIILTWRFHSLVATR